MDNQTTSRPGCLHYILWLVGVGVVVWFVAKRFTEWKLMLKREWNIDLDAITQDFIQEAMHKGEEVLVSEMTKIQPFEPGREVARLPQLADLPAPMAPRVLRTPSSTPVAPKVGGANLFELNDRQKQIFELIRRNSELNMSQIAEQIQGVTDRTLRRDMTKLERLGLVAQVGKTRDSVYKLKD